jgi:hypothetical protein
MGLPAPNHQLKVPVVRRPAYTLSIEQATPLHAFIHCDIHGRWSSTTKRSLTADWLALKDLHGGPFYAQHTLGDRLHAHFLSMFGFTRVLSFTDDAGVRLEIHISKDPHG